MDNLAKQFQRYFEIVHADTPALLDEALRLRYQVYCLETGFEAQSDFSGGIEFDQFDLFSVHAIIRHKRSGNAAANTRLILPRSHKSDFHFPIQDLVKDDQIQEVVQLTAENRSNFAEISRFCVSRDFKHRFHEEDTIAGVGEDPEDNEGRTPNGRLLPHITIALFASIFAMSANEGISHWFAVMEPSLLRFLSRYGIDFKPIGPPVEHRGLRQPCYANADEVALSMWKKRPAIWRFVTQNGEVWPLPEEVREGRVISSNL